MPTYRKKRKFEKGIDSRYASMIIIATEGQETEKYYFDVLKVKYRNSAVCVKVIPSEEGRSSPEHIIDNLNCFRNSNEFDSDRDEFWLMIDKDRWPIDKFKRVIQEAAQKGYNFAVSNPCFECWLYLHFENIDRDRISSREMEKMLKKAAGGYKKPNVEGHKYEERVIDAIKRAKAIDIDPAERWPNRVGTHVYKVVEKCVGGRHENQSVG
ncbi:MAG TPA: RloB family protein [bacterium]|nr:RloB family protein [bacterium]